MDEEKKKDLVRTVLIAVFFLAIAIVLLNIFIGTAMESEPPRL